MKCASGFDDELIELQSRVRQHLAGCGDLSPRGGGCGPPVADDMARLRSVQLPPATAGWKDDDTRFNPCWVGVPCAEVGAPPRDTCSIGANAGPDNFTYAQGERTQMCVCVCVDGVCVVCMCVHVVCMRA